MTPTDFRARIERALRRQFGSALVDTSGDKAIDVAAGPNTLDADVVPCFELHRYDTQNHYVVGQRLFPKSGGKIDNFPQQDYDNGVRKNTATGRRYKQIVRCLKRLEAELFEEGRIPREYPGYLIECLVYNVPNWKFGNATLYADLEAVLDHLWDATNSREEAYIFRTDAHTMHRDGNPPSRGAATLKVGRRPQLHLVGDYWMERGTRGSITSVGNTPKTYDTFEAARQATYKPHPVHDESATDPGARKLDST